MPEITAWLAITVAAVVRITNGSWAQSGCIVEERIVGRRRRRCAMTIRALPEIVEQQAGNTRPNQAMTIGLRPKWPRSA